MKKIICGLAIALCLCASVFAKPASKGKKGKTEAVSVNFTRDYNNGWVRLYSVKDYLAGIYRPNFRNIPQKDLVDGPNDSKVGIFDFDGTPITIGWVTHDNGGNSIYMTGEEDGKTVSYIDEKIGSKQECSWFSFDNWTGLGIETQIEIKGEKYVVAIAGRNSDYDGFRFWVEESVSMEAAETKRDGNGLTNYDYIDFAAGVYKPGYKRLWGTFTTDPNYTIYYESANAKTSLYNYNGTEFIVGFANDTRQSVRTTDGKIINPTGTYMKFMQEDNGKPRLGLGVGWEGKVKLGDESVTMALCMCNGQVRVYIKE